MIPAHLLPGVIAQIGANGQGAIAEVLEQLLAMVEAQAERIAQLEESVREPEPFEHGMTPLPLFAPGLPDYELTDHEREFSTIPASEY